MISSQPANQRLHSALSESRDGSGAADHDQPYRFGRRPHATAPYSFSTRQFARLLVLRSRVQAGQFGADDVR